MGTTEALACLKEALSELPNTPEEVADFLAAEGIHGSPGKCARCPIAKYLTGRLAKAGHRHYVAHVVREEVYLKRESFPSLILDQLDLPIAVSDFIRQFDDDFESFPQVRTSWVMGMDQ